MKPKFRKSSDGTFYIYKDMGIFRVTGFMIGLICVAQLVLSYDKADFNVFAWACVSTLCWHLLFLKSRLILSANDSVLIFKSSSLYPIRTVRYQLKNMTSVIATRHPIKKEFYQYHVEFENLSRVTLGYSRAHENVRNIAKELAEHIDKPFVDDIRGFFD
ncbi:hypothetical protein KDW99_11065 [Marinomonas rhizomae]|uniref:hypothetical protein n=1 Tax=Marinomonas rhizomae TaxID=491948 RepID=UPI0021061BF1|nr:hypothetical protein [Marinomonas rhizomae]UTV97841.1 hypothetical protein KDW99_11065 [Marinomonas rhizomae]